MSLISIYLYIHPPSFSHSFIHSSIVLLSITINLHHPEVINLRFKNKDLLLPNAHAYKKKTEKEKEKKTRRNVLARSSDLNAKAHA